MDFVVYLGQVVVYKSRNKHKITATIETYQKQKRKDVKTVKRRYCKHNHIQTFLSNNAENRQSIFKN